MTSIRVNWPPRASGTIWAMPLYGTWVMRTLAWPLICSSIRCPSDPTPAVASDSPSGSALAWVSMSLKSLPVNFGPPTRYTGEYMTAATGAKSFNGSYSVFIT
ncbi:hypothetical protein D3C71_1646940 [compost metagenome]